MNMPVEHTEQATILQIVQRAASDPSCDIDKMERLMQMHERLQARQAEQAFNDALAQLQVVLPEVSERGAIKNRNGDKQSTYALWEDINQAIKPVLAQHGFALSFRTSTETGIAVTGVLSHKLGHREESSILLPADVSGSKNAVQAIASSISYGKRYTAGALLNLTSRGEDDDGQAGGDPVEAWLTEIDGAKTTDELASVRTRAVKAMNETKNRPGYERLAKEAARRKAELEAANA